MFKCQRCNLKETKVCDSRYDEIKKTTKRTRICQQCFFRFVTTETFSYQIKIRKTNDERLLIQQQKQMDKIKKLNNTKVRLKKLEKHIARNLEFVEFTIEELKMKYQHLEKQIFVLYPTNSKYKKINLEMKLLKEEILIRKEKSNLRFGSLGNLTL